MQLDMPVKPEWLRASFQGKLNNVDREKGIVYGVILAESGPFKSEGRGEFNDLAIQQITDMVNTKANGLKSRWTHPGLSSDGLGKHLGRMKDAYTETVMRDGKPVLATKANLHLDKTALEEPVGGGKPYGVYVMDLAESDPEAFGTSLVIKPKQEQRLDKHGRPLKDSEGNDLPPLWYPEELHASDVVDTGDATNSFLSADLLAGLPDAIVRQGCELLDKQFAGQSREVIESRLSAFVARYLSYRFGDEPEKPAEPDNSLEDYLLADELEGVA